MKNLWHQLTPSATTATTPPLANIANYLALPQTEAQLDAGDCQRRYPHRVRQGLHQRELSRLLANPVDDPLGETSSGCLTMWHAAQLNHLLAGANGSLAISVGINYLAMLPAYIAGSAAQLRELFAQVHVGKYAAILLSEAAHGSDLRQNETIASRVDDGYVLTGQKDFINGGSQHELLTVLARLDETNFNFFLLERSKNVTSPQRWPTLPMPGADIASVCLDGVTVSDCQRLGHVGSGFKLLQKTFTFSRGGIGSWNAGVAQRAVDLASDYAQTRHLYGAPILHLGAIADHLLTMRAMQWLLTAVTLKTTALLNTYGSSATFHASVTKYGSSALAELLINEGRLLHGARGLLMDWPYHQLVRDVLVYGTFDGTSHIVLAQIEARLQQMVKRPSTNPSAHLATISRAYQQPPANLVQVARQKARPLLIPLPDYLPALAELTTNTNLEPLLILAQALWQLVEQSEQSGLWATDQGWRFELAKQLVLLEMLVAVVELGDSGCRQTVLPVQAEDPITAEQRLIYDYALGRFGSQVADTLRQLAWQNGDALTVELTAVAQHFTVLMHQARKEIQQNLESLIR